MRAGCAKALDLILQKIAGWMQIHPAFYEKVMAVILSQRRIILTDFRQCPLEKKGKMANV
jgi:hypothetical protein